jgi:hypothetical protein
MFSCIPVELIEYLDNILSVLIYFVVTIITAEYAVFWCRCSVTMFISDSPQTVTVLFHTGSVYSNIIFNSIGTHAPKSPVHISQEMEVSVPHKPELTKLFCSLVSLTECLCFANIYVIDYEEFCLPCSAVKVNWCFKGIYHLHLQGLRGSQARNQLHAFG